ncbi:GAF and ANTAR domain-containing protein [Frigoribacterium sp. VKM Ac-1396]|uniref:ANTAR domain-containing protein n=1 Tax=Frigoribacterium sp. VKM Ac-1396 TaxID=2783821 RepID=UPI00188C6D9F|nr:GAF and ANTAR domain-containing protein [Frigoribacterium sp. VKM Ac-1396]
MAAHRERRLLHAIVRLAGNATGPTDRDDRLQVLVDESVALFDAHAAGLMLFGRSGDLQVAASTGHHAGLLELLQVETGEGPCLEAARTGEVVAVPDVAAAVDRWPHFSRVAVDAGYASVHSVPLRLRDEVIGSLNLFGETAGTLAPEDLASARALADIATIGILQQRVLDDGASTRAQLQAALDSRTVIEQAKGWLANRDDVDTDVAFGLLRDHARRNRLPLTEVALGVLAGRISLRSAATDET